MLACKRGQIIKNAYETKRGVHVSETCIKDRGLKGKTGPERKINFHTVSFDVDILGNFGYKNIMQKTLTERREALQKAIKAYGAVDVLRKINILAILTKNTMPLLSAKFNYDKQWIHNTYHTNKRMKAGDRDDKDKKYAGDRKDKDKKYAGDRKDKDKNYAGDRDNKDKKDGGDRKDKDKKYAGDRKDKDRYKKDGGDKDKDRERYKKW